MNELEKLPNISKVIAGKLIEAGVTSQDELIVMGSNEAFVRIRLKDSTACLHMLYALEGAIQGVRWHILSDETKADLRTFYKTF